MTPEQMMGMIRAGHDVEHVLDIKSADDRAAFRAFMLKEAETNPLAGPALEHYDQAMRDLDSGVMGARGTWHALSKAQRFALKEAARHGGRFERVGTEYRHRDRKQAYLPIHVRTIRPLCARELMAWDGMTNGGNDPEAAAVLTERGLFVLKHGPSVPGPTNN